ncbi:MAG: TolC family protein [Planctomycetota bacterium]|jgi:outer membrane protein TolC
MRPFLLAALVVILSSCASSVEREYEGGAVTPYARSQLAQPGAGALRREPANATSEMKEAEEHLEKLAEKWKARARKSPADPADLGFPPGPTPRPEDLEKQLSPELVYAAAYGMSPRIRSAQEAFKATVEQFDQVAYLDAILRQYSSFTKDLDLRIGAPRQKERLERFFPFPGSMSLKTRIVEEESKAAEERLARTMRTELVAIGKAYFDYAYVREATGIVRENIELLKGIGEVAQSKYGVGKTGQAVVLKAHVEIASLEDKLVTLREREATVRASMNSILGLPAEFALGPPESHEPLSPPEDPTVLYPVAARERQEIAALSAKIRRTEALIELAETKAYPDLSLGFSRFQEGTGTRVGGARMKEPFEKDPRQMPRFWFGETASFIQEMRSRLESMRRDLEGLDARVAYQVKDAWFKWDAAWRQVRLYSDSLLPPAEQAYKVLESGWQEGVADFLDALDAQRTWLKFRLEHRAAVRDTNRGRLALLDALGTKLPAGEGK